MAKLKLLLIDNYDSFTYNLEHYLQLAVARVDTVRCDAAFLSVLEQGHYDAVVISPGPGRPKDSGNLMFALELLSRNNSIPVLGICLGMQAMGEFLGFSLIKAPVPVHGKTSLITHCGKGIFTNLESPLEVMRYHSLILDQINSEVVEVTAHTLHDHLPMGLKSYQLPWEGVQFHPESIGTPSGMKMIENWVTSTVLLKGIRKA